MKSTSWIWIEYLASVLGYDRIQVFLDAHPEKSGFLGFPDLLMVIGEAGGFRDLLMVTWGSESFPRFADGYRGSRWFPGLADGHLRETSSFRTCPRSSRANQWFPRLDDQHLIYSGFTLSSLQSAEKYFGLRSSRRAASARLPPVFCRVLSIIAFFESGHEQGNVVAALGKPRHVAGSIRNSIFLRRISKSKRHASSIRSPLEV